MPDREQAFENSQSTAQCSDCGQALGLLTTSDNLCPSCLLSTAIEDLQSDDFLARYASGKYHGAPCTKELNERIPQFEFLELLGGGGSGWVYLAKQLSLNRLVAVKLLGQRRGRVLSTHERFSSEAQTLANLNHSLLVTVHDYGTTEEADLEGDAEGVPHCYLVMEYVPGPTLRHKLRSGPLSVKLATRIALQICQAIQYAHAQGIVHRDLKPENILFVSDAEDADLKVADFGIAKLIGDGESSTSYTATGTVVGTPYYMAPERHLASSAATPQSDIYSLGVLLYEMLTGQIPIGNFPPLEKSHGIAKPLSDAVQRAIAASPAERFSSAAELQQAIQSSGTVSPMRRASGPYNSTFKRAIAGVLLLTLGIAGGYYLSQGEADTSLDAKELAVSNAAVTSNETPEEVEQVPKLEETEQNESGAASPAETKPPVKSEQSRTNPKFGNSGSGSEVVRRGREASGYDVEILNVSIRRDPPFGANIRFDLLFRDTEVTAREGSKYYWIFQDSLGNEIESEIPPLEGRTEITIDEPVRTRHAGGFWPGEIYVEERWGENSSGKRRISEVFQVQGWHVRIGAGF